MVASRAELTLESPEKVTWRTAVQRMDWRQGEHTTLVGPTGVGKTELLTHLLETHPWVVFLGTKQTDDTQTRLTREMGYREISSPHELNMEVSRHFLFRPPFPKVDAKTLRASHQRAFRELLMRAYRQQAWTVAVDELRYVAHFLGLTDELMLIWLQGRSQGSAILGGTQRPRFVPLEAYDQATHLFFWRDPDSQNVRREAEIAGINQRTVLQVVPRLPRHDVFYVNTVTGETFITNTRW